MTTPPDPIALNNVLWMQKPEKDPVPEISPVRYSYAIPNRKDMAIDAHRKHPNYQSIY
jgi:hypothetical protein